MVADEYFELRSRLGAALFSLGNVADLAGLKPSRGPVVKSLVEGLRDPFVFVVAGEVNAGKSTLLNALFGEEFCPSGVLPETRRIHHFRYGRTPQRVALGLLLEEVALPHAFLRDFQVVDTPGVNSIEEGHERITGEFIPRADAVLFCFPATNPWSQAAWEFLGRIHRDWLKKIVLVLQQADLRTPGETSAIAEHMQRIAMERLGVELPVFPVSARLALLARTSGLDKSRLLAESAFPAFEQHLTRLVAETAPRLAKLVTACSAGQALLAEVQSKLAIAAEALTDLKQLQAQAREAMDGAATDTRKQAEETTQSLRAAWHGVTRAALEAALAERRAFPRLLTGLDPTAETIESRLLPPLLTAVREHGNAFEGQLDRTLGALWKNPGAALHRSVEGHTRRPPEPAWPSRGGLFPAHLENALCETVAAGGLAVFWKERLKRRQSMMRGLSLLVLLILAGGIAGIATGALPPAAAGWLTAVGIGGVLTGRSVQRRETAETSAGAAPLLAAAADQFTVRTRSLTLTHGEMRLNDFLPCTAPLESSIRQKEQTTAPLMEEARQLALTLQSLARSWHGVAAGEG